MLTMAGQVVNVTKAPVFVVVLVEVPVLLGGKNVNVSPSVVMTSFVVKPVGTDIVLVPQIKKPEEEVTTTPSGRVPVNPGAFPVEAGSPVGINVNISPTRLSSPDRSNQLPQSMCSYPTLKFPRKR